MAQSALASLLIIVSRDPMLNVPNTRQADGWRAGCRRQRRLPTERHKT